MILGVTSTLLFAAGVWVSSGAAGHHGGGGPSTPFGEWIGSGLILCGVVLVGWAFHAQTPISAARLTTFSRHAQLDTMTPVAPVTLR